MEISILNYIGRQRRGERKTGGKEREINRDAQRERDIYIERDRVREGERERGREGERERGREREIYQTHHTFTEARRKVGAT